MRLRWSITRRGGVVQDDGAPERERESDAYGWGVRESVPVGAEEGGGAIGGCDLMVSLPLLFCG